MITSHIFSIDRIDHTGLKPIVHVYDHIYGVWWQLRLGSIFNINKFKINLIDTNDLGMTTLIIGLI
jgi:hypothetical protein